MLTKDQIHKKLVQLAAAHFEQDLTDMHPDDDFFEVLEIDSYQAMELLTELEETFDVEVPDWEVQDVRTFGALAEVIDRRL